MGNLRVVYLAARNDLFLACWGFDEYSCEKAEHQELRAINRVRVGGGGGGWVIRALISVATNVEEHQVVRHKSPHKLK
jgi:hypothetical protein